MNREGLCSLSRMSVFTGQLDSPQSVRENVRRAARTGVNIASPSYAMRSLQLSMPRHASNVVASMLYSCHYKDGQLQARNTHSGCPETRVGGDGTQRRYKVAECSSP